MENVIKDSVDTLLTVSQKNHDIGIFLIIVIVLIVGLGVAFIKKFSK